MAEEADLPALEIDPDDFVFDLCGIIVHLGLTADSGHYYSFIRERSSDRWFHFNGA